MHVLLDDDRGRLTVRRLRPWHHWLARALAARLDRQLADGAQPEASAMLAARAVFLTSDGFRRGLAASLRRILAAAAAAAAPRLRSQAPARDWPPGRQLRSPASLFSRSAGTGSSGRRLS